MKLIEQLTGERLNNELRKGVSLESIISQIEIDDDNEIFISAVLIFEKILSDEKEKNFTTKPEAYSMIISELQLNFAPTFSQFWK